MVVSVKWFPTLVKRTRLKQAEVAADWRPGLTPRDIFVGEGFNDTDLDAVMVLINDEKAQPSAALQDNDHVEFLVSLQGG